MTPTARSAFDAGSPVVTDTPSGSVATGEHAYSPGARNGLMAADVVKLKSAKTVNFSFFRDNPALHSVTLTRRDPKLIENFGCAKLGLPLWTERSDWP